MMSGLLAAQDKPNIVIIVADDLGYADPGYKNSGIDTPSIDSLAAEGVEMTRFYATPICSPTRAALMTGRDPIRLGVAFGVILPWDSGGVHTNEHFMPQSFQAAGYQTAMVGKWHLGHAQKALTPNARGFDEFYGHLHTETGFYPPFNMVGGKDFQRNGVSIDDQGYESYLLADHAEKWIKSRDKQRPFFMYMPFLAPHEPLQAPQALIDKYADMKDERERSRGTTDSSTLRNMMAGDRRGLYAAVVDGMDQAIGQVLDTLEAEGIADNTIVLFFSDNGATRLAGRGGGDNAPFRGGKAETYEGGIRVISLARWPGKLKAGKKIDETVTVMDVFPTLAAAAGVKPLNHYELDGLNMWPVLSGKGSVKRSETLFFGSEIPTYGTYNFTAIDGDWKLVQWLEQELTTMSISQELFNLVEDPGEYNNLADEHPKRVEELAQQILEWRSLYPVNGTHARISAPPGWHAPKDWADYPRDMQALQPKALSTVAPFAAAEYLLDKSLGERGRLIYNCEPLSWMFDVCPPRDDPEKPAAKMH